MVHNDVPPLTASDLYVLHRRELDDGEFEKSSLALDSSDIYLLDSSQWNATLNVDLTLKAFNFV